MQPSPTLSAALTPPHSARRRTPPYTHASVIPHNRPAHFDSRNSPLLPRGTAPPAHDAQNIINKPTIFQADWNSTIINKPTLFSGNYNDLTNKPTTTLGVVGSYGLFAYFPTSFIDGPQGPTLLPGDTSAGSKLFYANTVNYTYTSAGSGTVYRIGAYNWSPSGTWRLMGQIGYTRDGNPTFINNNFGIALACVSLWVRIS